MIDPHRGVDGEVGLDAGHLRLNRQMRGRVARVAGGGRGCNPALAVAHGDVGNGLTSLELNVRGAQRRTCHDRLIVFVVRVERRRGQTVRRPFTGLLVVVDGRLHARRPCHEGRLRSWRRSTHLFR